ncbi:hypothetical protein ACHHYP_12778 [Achlya hypogyna]|uniref:Vacuolar protein sorting-associated protein n=1 Tax=Achlya hypogyna TaxID=1202772 RepID=A0A1V9YGI6_ACHHY|nr:hypothetical protein ACHHYP_12778 [Achlya hypogyna]
MVLESVAALLVNKLCARFIKDFRKENLHISFTGEVSLSAFEVRMGRLHIEAPDNNEIYDLQLPIEPRSLYIGHLRTNIIAAELTSQPLHIQLSDVVLLVSTPRAPANGNYIEALDFAHQSQIDWLVRLLHNKPSPAAVNGPKANTDLHWFNRFRDAFVSVERLHIRFEDAASGLSVGLQVDAPKGRQPVVQILRASADPLQYRSEPAVDQVLHAKTMALTNFSVYIERDQIFATASKVPTNSLYVVDPSKVQLQLNVTIPEATVVLSLAHLAHLQALLESIDLVIRQRLYRRFRPQTRGVRGLWKYAITAVLLDLQDPVRHRPSWRQTWNLLFIGLQYTALRRYLAPYIVRKPWRQHDYFLHYKEELANIPGGKSPPALNDAAIAVTRVKTGIDHLPKEVSQYGRGVFAGVYGLGRRFAAHRCQPMSASTADLVPRLFARQQYIDACFRPIVMAKLRVLAANQTKQHLCNKIDRLHNRTKGILTVTLVQSTLELDRYASSMSSMLVFAKLKIGTNGVAYSAPPVHSSTTARTCSFPFVWVPKQTSCSCTFAQSFEFHLKGTADEDYLHLELLDRWPLEYLNQSLGAATLPLLDCTRPEPYTTNVSLALTGCRGQAHILTCFVPADSTTPSVPTSQALLRDLYPALYPNHQWISWYHKEEQPFKLHHLRYEPPPAFTLNAVSCSIESLTIQLAIREASKLVFAGRGVHLTLNDITQLDLRQRHVTCTVAVLDVVYEGASRVVFKQEPCVRLEFTDSRAAAGHTIAMQVDIPNAVVSMGLPTAVQLHQEHSAYAGSLKRVLGLVFSPIYGPFGLLVAPAAAGAEPAKHAPPPTIDTSINVGAMSFVVADLATMTLPALQCEIGTACNDATTTVAVNGVEVGLVVWTHWEAIRKQLREVRRQTRAAPTPMPLPTPRHRTSLWFLTQGIAVREYSTPRWQPQDRVLFVDTALTTLYIAKSRWASSPQGTLLDAVCVQLLTPYRWLP